jgi:hypothetical protein
MKDGITKEGICTNGEVQVMIFMLGFFIGGIVFMIISFLS